MEVYGLEEKKAIEYLKRHIIPCYGRKGTIEFMLNDIVLNLIEKQSKEIEELKENECVYKDTSSCNKALSFKTYKKLNDIDNKWKDKIKAKIEELDYNDIGNFERRCKQEVLQSLLEKE